MVRRYKFKVGTTRLAHPGKYQIPQTSCLGSPKHDGIFHVATLTSSISMQTSVEHDAIMIPLWRGSIQPRSDLPQMWVLNSLFDSTLRNSLQSTVITHFFHMFSLKSGTMCSSEILLMAATLSWTAYLANQVTARQECKFRIASYDLAVPAG